MKFETNEKEPMSKQQAHLIEYAINTFGDSKLVAEELNKMHPTLQQSFMRLCLRFIKLQSQEHHTDLRNEQSKKIAQKIDNALEEIDYYLPFI